MLQTLTAPGENNEKWQTPSLLGCDAQVPWASQKRLGAAAWLSYPAQLLQQLEKPWLKSCERLQELSH